MEQLHLDIFQDEYEAVCKLYWELESENKFTYKVSEIANIVGLKASQISSIVRKSCVAYSNSVHCNICETAYELTGRNDYDSHHYRHTSWKCNDCLEDEKEKQRKIRKQQIIKFIDSTRVDPIDLSELTLKEAVYLLSFIRHSANEMLTGFNAVVENRIEQLMPQPDSDAELIRGLYFSDLIALSDDTSQHAFSFEGDKLTSFSLVNAIWRLEFQEGDSLGNVLKRLEDLLSDSEYIETVSDELCELITEISLMECLAYLEYNLGEHNLPFKPGEKTKNVFLQAMKTLSVAQIYTFIWRACKDAAAYYMRGGISKQQAANAVVGNIQRQHERAIANSWTVGEFKRNYNLPQSILSQVVFNFILRTDDGGFNQKVSSLFDCKRIMS